jgi:glycosyltransferase involved in cell wall biosynthesis
MSQDESTYVTNAMTRPFDRVPRISIIIPVHNGGDGLVACLSSLAALRPAPLEIIVVDDGSTDGSARVASEAGATVFQTATRSGPAHARNLGAQHARGDVLLFMDADVAVRPDTVGLVAHTFQHRPGLSALFGSYDDEPAATDFVSQYKNLMQHFVHQAGREDAFTFWAGCGAIRPDVFLALGGFDERYRQPAIEDIELGYRLRSAGHKILLLKTLQVKHLKPWRPPGLLRSDFVQRALPWSELILKHRRLANDLNIGWTSRVSVAAAYGLVGALLAAWRWPRLLALAGLCLLVLLLVNAPLYRFFARKRGLLFALRAIPWHWFYFLYSGLAFALALVRHLYRSIGLRPRAEDRPRRKKRGRKGVISKP